MPEPPRTLDDLRKLAKDSRTQATGSIAFGSRAESALATMLKSPARTAVLTISEIAADANVDPATLSRLGQKIGFDGFNGLHDIFRRHVTDNARFYSDHMEQLIERTSYQGSQDRWRILAESEADSVRATLESVEESLEEAADLMAGAKKIVVLGLRSTYAATFFLGSYLRLLRDGVTIAGGPDLIDGDLAQLGERDLLVAATFRPYTKLTVLACEVAEKAGVPVLAITDRRSPLAIRKRHRLPLIIDGVFHFNKALAPFFVAELLLVAVAEKLGRKALAVTNQRQSFVEAMGTELNHK